MSPLLHPPPQVGGNYKDSYDEIIPNPGSIKIVEELDDEEFQAEKSPKASLIKGRGRTGGRTKTELKD